CQELCHEGRGPLAP
ncbi:hypothetical protein BN1723_020050, partial [Verticillium longisporum]